MSATDELLNVAMKKIRGFISGIVLVAVAALSSGQTADTNPLNLSANTAPKQRWKYESGG